MKEMDIVILKEDLPEHKLKAGDVGTIVNIYGNHEAYEAEFVSFNGNTVAVETLSPEQIEILDKRAVVSSRLE